MIAELGSATSMSDLRQPDNARYIRVHSSQLTVSDVTKTRRGGCKAVGTHLAPMPLWGFQGYIVWYPPEWVFLLQVGGQKIENIPTTPKSHREWRGLFLILTFYSVQLTSTSPTSREPDAPLILSSRLVLQHSGPISRSLCLFLEFIRHLSIASRIAQACRSSPERLSHDRYPATEPLCARQGRPFHDCKYSNCIHNLYINSIINTTWCV